MEFKLNSSKKVYIKLSAKQISDLIKFADGNNRTIRECAEHLKIDLDKYRWKIRYHLEKQKITFKRDFGRKAGKVWELSEKMICYCKENVNTTPLELKRTFKIEKDRGTIKSAMIRAGLI